MKSTQTLNKAARVLAFDPGFERLGCAVVERRGGKETLLYSACIQTPKTLPFVERLALLGEAVEKLFVEWEPAAMALEDVYFSNNAKTAMKVAEVRGMLTYLAGARRIPLFEYTPLQVKVAITGYGKSDKTAVSAMVARLVQIPDKKRLDDELDAIAVGLTCLASERATVAR